MSSFLTSVANKAHEAVKDTPLAQYIPSGRAGTPDQDGSGSSLSKSHTFEAIQHHLKTFGQQYTSTTPIQKIITVEKGVAIDFDSLSGNAKAQSKELYMWGQTEAADVKDVSDRLAYINFVQGSLAGALALKLDTARIPFKAVRDAETALAPRRNLRAGLQNQISNLESGKGMEKKAQEFKEQLRRHEYEDQAKERELDVLKRKALRESEQVKWEALREFGEKLVLLSQAATPIISALPAIPPSASSPYTGAQATAAARASLQHALDNFKTGHVTNAFLSTEESDLSRSDTRSFGETHASELSSIKSGSTHSVPGIPITPPTNTKPLPGVNPSGTGMYGHGVSLHDQPAPPSSFPTPATQGIDPGALNHNPTPLPTAKSPPSAHVDPLVDPTVAAAAPVPVITPTIADTGVPISSPTGPGPASGSLKNIHAASDMAGAKTGGKPEGSGTDLPAFGSPAGVASGGAAVHYESAEDEKKRLQREERERLLSGAPSSAAAVAPSASTTQPTPASTGPTPKYETAEEEKKRLEREERERLLHAGGSTHVEPPAQGGSTGGATGLGRSSTRFGEPPKKDDEDLPPYQDIQ